MRSSRLARTSSALFGFSFDADYVRRLCDGDVETEHHFHTYFGRLLAIKLRQRLRSPQAILDARQETLMRVLVSVRQKHTLEHPERLGAFVNAVCRNVLLEMGRAEQRTVPWDEDGHDPRPTTAADDPETALVTAEAQARVHQVLEKLPERDRELLRRIFLEEENKDAVCRQFGVDREYLRVLLHRAKARFRAAYQPDGGIGSTV